MKKLLISVLLLSMVILPVLTVSCTETTEVKEQVINDIEAQEAFDLIQDNKDNPDFIIVDVRTPEEYNEGHIENAVNIDYNSESFKSQVGELDKDKTYLVYCRSGKRSAGAVGIMKELEFMEINHLVVGIIGWTNEGFPVEN